MSERIAFVYGTLMAPELLGAILRRPVRLRPALLEGYHRGPMRGVSYPGIHPQVGSQVAGMVAGPCSTPEWRMLDIYESAIYQRLAVTVAVGGHPTDAWAYVLAPDEITNCGRGPWDFQAWRRRHLQRALARVERELGPS